MSNDCLITYFHTMPFKSPTIDFKSILQFLRMPLWLSPYKLPPEPGLHEHTDRGFGPIFGLFDDSLPEGWGLLLMDRFFRQQGFDIEQLTVLDRLTFLGNTTMGALVYEPATGPERFTDLINLKKLSDQSRQILEGRCVDVLPELIRTGGSPGGAKPKVLIGVNSDTIIAGEEDLSQGFEHWIVKFPSQKDFPDAGAVEYAYSLMAQNAGIQMPETRLFEANVQERFFGIKRFDRQFNQRFHVHTFGNVIHSNFRIPECDYETLLKVTLDLTKNHEDVKRIFRQMVFNVLANNRDDHVKNFAFMINEFREWTLTPAYDLVYSTGPGGEHSMTLSGEGRSPGKNEINKLGGMIGIARKEINGIVNQVANAVGNWPQFAGQAKVLNQTRDYIQERIDRNMNCAGV